MDNSLKYTKVARKAIREYGEKTGNVFLSYVYTNKYPKCRTVKTYAEDANGKLRDTVSDALRASGCDEFSIKVNKSVGPLGRWIRYSFIVRIPREDME